MIEQDQPGFRWCPKCHAQIPDAFSDHFEKHEADEITPPDQAVAFWAMCLALGVVAAFVVDAVRAW